MKTELKDVLHLYLGCDCKYEWINEPKVELKGKVTASIIDSVYSDNGVIQWVKPILRPLSDMADVECIEFFGLPKDSIIIKKRDYPDSISFEYKFIHPEINNADGYSYSGVGIGKGGNSFNSTKFLYLLKNGFDLFGLIESSQAINKTKL